MKKTIICGIIMMAGLFVPKFIQAQGTVYMSNINHGAIGNNLVESNFWWAAPFFTGSNSNGYVLNSIQLTFSGGRSNGFTAMLYSETGTNMPGSSLGVLDGSLNPTSGTYAYTPDSSLTLSSSTDYYIVLTATNGAYAWDNASSSVSYNPSGGWNALHSLFYSNDNGLRWNLIGGANPEFAVSATPVPEPTSSLLLLLGSGVFIYVRRTFHR